jgi:uroporphyrinogen-III decarboxylase
MSDYPYPKPAGEWFELEPLDNPFPEQIRALEIINTELAGSAHSIETIFNPYNVAEKLSSAEEVRRMKDEEPDKLVEALEIIAESECNHARKAIAAGASGVFLAIANADESNLTREEYKTFSEPFDKRIFTAVAGAPMNAMHLHGDNVYLDMFYSGWDATIFHYAAHATGVPVADVRQQFDGVIMGGWDYKNILDLSEAELRNQWEDARAAAGLKFLLAPGCSVPNESTDEELLRITGVVAA